MKGWGNPEESAEGVLGMLVPADISPLADSGWAVVITYDEDGYVDDKGAESIDYTALLKEMPDYYTRLAAMEGEMAETTAVATRRIRRAREWT